MLTDVNWSFYLFFLEQREKSNTPADDQLGEFELSKVMARKQPRTVNRTTTAPYSSNEVNIHFSFVIIFSMLSVLLNRKTGNKN